MVYASTYMYMQDSPQHGSHPVSISASGDLCLDTVAYISCYLRMCDHASKYHPYKAGVRSHELS